MLWEGGLIRLIRDERAMMKRYRAKKYGLTPRKGMISVGSDADLVVIDLNKNAELSNEDLYTRAGYSCFDGWEFKGWPILTMVRGNVVAESRNLYMANFPAGGV